MRYEVPAFLALFLLSGCNCSERFLDEDGDGFGSDFSHKICGRDDMYVERTGDCDDLDPAAHPEAVEVCNGIDDDCDGDIDEGFDEDGDGVTSCDGDCDDTEPTVYPGAEERCDAFDNDCDGVANEDFDDEWEENDIVDDAPLVAGNDEQVVVEGRMPGEGDDEDWFMMDTIDDIDSFGSDSFFARATLLEIPPELDLELCLWRNDVTATARLIGCDDTPADGLSVVNEGVALTNEGNLHFAQVIRRSGWSCEGVYVLELANDG